MNGERIKAPFFALFAPLAPPNKKWGAECRSKKQNKIL
jgi:hypothetical protein